MKSSRKRGRKPDFYTMWLCYHLTCVVDEDIEFLPLHKRCEVSVGGYVEVGGWLHLSPEGVEYHVRNAQKLRDTAAGMQKYSEWLTQREQRWWWYHTVCVELRELKLNEAPEVRNPENVRDEQDYKAWLTWYEKRNEKGKAKPLAYRTMSSNDPVAIAFQERRAAKGLRNGLTKVGRKRAKTK
jgi:hypothetical protein